MAEINIVDIGRTWNQLKWVAQKRSEGQRLVCVYASQRAERRRDAHDLGESSDREQRRRDANESPHRELRGRIDVHDVGISSDFQRHWC